MHNRQPLTLKMIWQSTMDYHLWPVYLIGLLFGIPAVPVKQYLQLSFKQLGFSTIEANLLTIPSTALSVINCVLIAVLSELVNNRSFVCMAEDLVCCYHVRSYQQQLTSSVVPAMLYRSRSLAFNIGVAILCHSDRLAWVPLCPHGTSVVVFPPVRVDSYKNSVSFVSFVSLFRSLNPLARPVPLSSPSLPLSFHLFPFSPISLPGLFSSF